MEWGEAITRGTAQAATAFYLSRLLLDAGGSRLEKWDTQKRIIWTLGCLALWLHIAFAFEFVHNWSHADAFRATAEQTAEVTGWRWGGGVYVNYSFAVLWLLDVIAWWRRGVDYPRESRRRYWFTQALFGFLFFNATAVFGPGYWKAAIGVVILAWLAIYAWSRDLREA